MTSGYILQIAKPASTQDKLAQYFVSATVPLCKAFFGLFALCSHARGGERSENLSKEMLREVFQQHDCDKVVL